MLTTGTTASATIYSRAPKTTSCLLYAGLSSPYFHRLDLLEPAERFKGPRRRYRRGSHVGIGRKWILIDGSATPTLSCPSLGRVRATQAFSACQQGRAGRRQTTTGIGNRIDETSYGPAGEEREGLNGNRVATVQSTTQRRRHSGEVYKVRLQARWIRAWIFGREGCGNFIRTDLSKEPRRNLHPSRQREDRTEISSICLVEGLKPEAWSLKTLDARLLSCSRHTPFVLKDTPFWADGLPPQQAVQTNTLG